MPLWHARSVGETFPTLVAAICRRDVPSRDPLCSDTCVSGTDILVCHHGVGRDFCGFDFSRTSCGTRDNLAGRILLWQLARNRCERRGDSTTLCHCVNVADVRSRVSSNDVVNCFMSMTSLSFCDFLWIDPQNSDRSDGRINQVCDLKIMKVNLQNWSETKSVSAARKKCEATIRSDVHIVWI
jgi:hypothetical protein